MRSRFVLGGENAGALERDVNAELLPGQLRRVFDRRDLDGAVAAIDAVALDGDFAGEAAMYGIVAKQVCVGLDRGEIVDGEDLDVLAPGLDGGAQNVAADAAKSVDRYAYRHNEVSLRFLTDARAQPWPPPPLFRG